MKYIFIDNNLNLRLAGEFASTGAAMDHVRYDSGSWPVVMVDEQQAREWHTRLSKLLDLRGLWETQLQLYPNSVRLPLTEVFEWARSATDLDRRERRWRCVAHAMQFGECVWYRTRPEGGSMGCRFGTEPDSYASGFDDI